jgi:predicted DNA-binding helix-hairpin-helix protein
MDTLSKLQLLADASRYDLACACGTKANDDHRQRTPDGMWLYPVQLPSGGTGIMLKTLLTNSCVNHCRYCPFRAGRDAPRCALEPEEVADTFMHFRRTRGVMGLFLSSGVQRDADHTMDRMLAAVKLLRHKHGFRGYVHLKIIPGASDAAIDDALSVASAVSLNFEAPTRSSFNALCPDKDYERHIVHPVRLISQLTGPGMRHAGVKQTTQFVVGAAEERDLDLLEAMSRLYGRLRMSRIYFSAYQRGTGEAGLPGEAPEKRAQSDGELLTREHRLYQVDFLLRKYGFQAGEIPVDGRGMLSLSIDPKEHWASLHPECFPVDVNAASRDELLRVPGLGPVTVDRVIAARRAGTRLGRLEDIGRPGKIMEKARGFLRFG